MTVISGSIRGSVRIAVAARRSFTTAIALRAHGGAGSLPAAATQTFALSRARRNKGDHKQQCEQKASKHGSLSYLLQADKNLTARQTDPSAGPCYGHGVDGPLNRLTFKEPLAFRRLPPAVCELGTFAFPTGHSTVGQKDVQEWVPQRERDTLSEGKQNHHGVRSFAALPHLSMLYCFPVGKFVPALRSWVFC